MTAFILNGLDGGHPLGYLAALGALNVSAQQWPQDLVKMVWLSHSGGWRPCMTLSTELNQETWLAALHAALLDPASIKPFTLADNLTIPCTVFRATANQAAKEATPQDRRYSDFLAAFGTEVIESEVNGKKTGEITDTAFRTMSGAGHQHFLGFMRELTKATEIEHLRLALFQPWSYTDPGPSLRWDPRDDRRYALRWRQPSGDPTRTVRGANRLAIEALPLFPTVPIGKRVETTGFTQRKKQGVLWTWPIWTTPLSLDVVRSLLTLPELGENVPDRKRLTPLGIAEVYRSQRITEGKYRNFTPARPI